MNYLTVSTAKPKLGRLLDKLLKDGKPVVIRRGNRFVQMIEYVVPDPMEPKTHGAYSVEENTADYGDSPRLHFKITLFQSSEGWAVSCPELPGCHSQGKTRNEALRNARDAIRLWLEVETEETGLKRIEQAEVLL